MPRKRQRQEERAEKQEELRGSHQQQGRRQAFQDDQAHLLGAAVAGHLLGTAQVEGQRVPEISKAADGKGRVQTQAVILLGDHGFQELRACGGVHLLNGPAAHERHGGVRADLRFHDHVYITPHVGDQDRQVDSDHQGDEEYHQPGERIAPHPCNCAGRFFLLGTRFRLDSYGHWFTSDAKRE